MQKKTDWLLSAAPGKNIKESLTDACCGNRRIQGLLYYFAYAANYAASDQNLSRENLETVTFKKNQIKMLEGAEKYADTKISPKTFRDWTLKLQNFGFIQADGYHQTYTVYIKKIQEAINNPPEPEPPLLRGRHAIKNDDTESQKVKSNKHSVKTTECKNSSSEEKGVLTFDSGVLSEKMEVLSQQMLLLTNENSRQAARIADLEAKNEALYKLITNLELSNTNSLSDATASAPPKAANGGRRKTQKNNVIPFQAPLPEEVFTEREKHVYDEWSKMHWHGGAPPKKTDTLIRHIKDLAMRTQLPTAEEMKTVKEWAIATKKMEINHGYQLGDFVRFYPVWLSIQKTQSSEPPKKVASSTPDPQETPKAQAHMTIAEMKKARLDALDQDKLVWWNTDADYFCKDPLKWSMMTIREARQYKFDGNEINRIQKYNMESEKQALLAKTAVV